MKVKDLKVYQLSYETALSIHRVSLTFPKTEQFGLAETGSKRVSAYSGGMRRRLDLSVALIVDPQILFVDEPTTGLDPSES